MMHGSLCAYVHSVCVDKYRYICTHLHVYLWNQYMQKASHALSTVYRAWPKLSCLYKRNSLEYIKGIKKIDKLPIK